MCGRGSGFHERTHHKGNRRKSTTNFASNVTFTVRNNKVDEFNRLMNGEVLPLLKAQKGFCQEVTADSGPS